MNWTTRYDYEGQACAAEVETETHIASVNWNERWMNSGDRQPWEWSVARHDMTAAKYGRSASMESAQKACEEAMR